MSLPSDLSGRDPDGLFARVKSGDQSAWEELFHTCYPKVVRVVRRRLNRPLRALYDSTDIASDVMKSLAANLDRLDFPSIDSLVAFLAQVAEQKVIDEYRRRHSRKRDINRERAITREDALGVREGSLASSDPTASQVAQAREFHERLLARTDESERVVIDLRRQGYSNAEIAKRTGWNIRKVQRFLKYLQDSLQKAGGG